jgi:predicted membrane protein
MSHFKERREFYRQMNFNNPQFQQYHKRKRTILGLFLVIIGAGLLLRTAHFPIPGWVFTWPMILIALGLFQAFSHNFKNVGWLFPTLIGTGFLLQEIYPGIGLGQYIWPIVIITIGLAFIFKPKRHFFHDYEKKNNVSANTTIFADEGTTVSSEDFIDSTSVFGGVKKTNISKNFQGGNITNIFGGAEINLLQTDFNGTATIDISEIFGGVKLIIPAHWQVRTDASAIFGGISDSRDLTNITLDPNKLLIIKGSVVFGGVDITNF